MAVSGIDSSAVSVVGTMYPGNRSATSLEDLHRLITDIGWVYVKFTATRGGTDLGIPVDREPCDLSAADLEQGRGTVHLEGVLTLNHDRVRCVADIDLQTLTGSGLLVPVEEPVLS